MADPKHIGHWMSKFDAMTWYQGNLAPEQHATRRGLFCDALAAMGKDRLDAACREWLKVGKHYPSPAELWSIEFAEDRPAMLPPPEHRTYESASASKPIIHDPQAMAAQLVQMRSNPKAYIGGAHLIAIGETMMRRGGFGHLVDVPGDEAEVW
jgi:hypothetical protein